MYKNFEEVEFHLKRLKLEREIALEELKGIKNDVKQDLSPYNWVSTAISAAKKFGMLYLVRKVVK
ncbi:MAG: hypothetical protein ABJO28_03125 [Maribacter dokdonensis]|jgi:hypothetical protein|uniref:Glutaminyl-tRNA synthetase n=2 Tax=Maribacter TaxID=252356 RepID=A0A1H4KUF3_9FLAO|nr:MULTISPECIES: hypothetical protein [Maribacter]HAF77317.1 hypothetical protein [Maribacter sp.]APA64218.1 glutaminyl-tRNA synthetase [Maribacter sp. 1_2014MBL_MicDiv]KSA12914.1 Glutaminyl-tRNA synthetase [Maribacter dokdonensis DSW-8]MBU2900679.1 hypothetical protein [Maribacter dokdonensis]MDP2526802.1 hypothetical protein [Maribacter dokdonensis]|tara:strand:- start:2404 stop:2598 length:195 start_codon:yes stop_codon:yes gene_type:complete